MGNFCSSPQRPPAYQPTEFTGIKVLCENPKLSLSSQSRYSYGKRGWIFGGEKEEIPATFLKFSDQKNLLAEIQILKHLDHKNVIGYFLNVKFESSVYVITEHIDKPLQAYIGEMNEYRDVVEQLVDGLQYLHEKPIAHLNLSTRSIFVSQTHGGFVLKIADFSYATEARYGKRFLLPRWASNDFAAPEIIKRNKVSLGSDIYSIGAIIFYIFCNRSKHIKDVNFPNFLNIGDFRRGPTFRDFLCADFIQKLTVRSQDDRPRAKLLRAHPFFWDAIKIKDFIIEVAKLLEPKGNIFHKYLGHKVGREVFEGSNNWTVRLNPYVLQQITKDMENHALNQNHNFCGEIKGYSVASLIRIMRNKAVHDSSSEILRETIGTPEKFVNFWLSIFPKLLPFVYSARIEYQKKYGI